MSNNYSNRIKWDIIPPEIKHDNFYNSIITTIASDNTIKNVIEIGASSGEGSTEAIILGCIQNCKNKLNLDKNLDIDIKVFSIEVCTERYERLKLRYRNIPVFHPYNVSSISIDEFPSRDIISNFYNTTHTTLNQYPLPMVMSWYDKDLEYINTNNIPQDGIEIIKKQHNIDKFDIALIDGSEFTGSVELDHLWGSKYILLDDINAFKNYHGHQKLKTSLEYQCIIEDVKTRNGFSIFKHL